MERPRGATAGRAFLYFRRDLPSAVRAGCEFRLPLAGPRLTTFGILAIPVVGFVRHEVFVALWVLANTSRGVAATGCGKLVDDGRENT